MNKIKVLVGAAILFIGLGVETNAQDVHFSQYFANTIYLNPAYAGSIVCPRITLNFRHQWPVLSGKYTSYSASYDQHFEKISGGIGVLFLGDYAAQGGQIVTNAFSLIYSFKADLSKKVAMRLGIQATCQQKRVDFNNLTFFDMIDAKYGFVNQTEENFPSWTTVVPDFSAGIICYSDHYYGGIAINHFTQPKESFFPDSIRVGENESEYKDRINNTRLPIKITANFGAVIDIKKYMKTEKTFGDVSLSPNVIFQYQSRMMGGAAYTTVNYGMYLACYPMVVGAWFRQGFKNADAAIFLAGIEHNYFKIGYSYDFTIPSQKNNKMKTGGAHEVSVQMYFPCPEKSRRIRNINCPKF